VHEISRDIDYVSEWSTRAAGSAVACDWTSRGTAQPIRVLGGINHVKKPTLTLFRIRSVMGNSVVHFCQSVCKVRCVCQTSSRLVRC